MLYFKLSPQTCLWELNEKKPVSGNLGNCIPAIALCTCAQPCTVPAPGGWRRIRAAGVHEAVGLGGGQGGCRGHWRTSLWAMEGVLDFVFLVVGNHWRIIITEVTWSDFYFRKRWYGNEQARNEPVKRLWQYCMWQMLVARITDTTTKTLKVGLKSVSSFRFWKKVSVWTTGEVLCG